MELRPSVVVMRLDDKRACRASRISGHPSSSTPNTVSSWSSLNSMLALILRMLLMAFNLTDWISSSNRSTRKSRHCSPNDGLAKLSRHIESTAANRTSMNSSSRLCTKAPQVPELTRLTSSGSTKSLGALEVVHCFPVSQSLTFPA